MTTATQSRTDEDALRAVAEEPRWDARLRTDHITVGVHEGIVTPADGRACTEDVMTGYEQGLVAGIAAAIAERRWTAFGLESCLCVGTEGARVRFPPLRPGA